MEATIQELFMKDVIDISNGTRVGMITDALIDLQTGKITAVIIGGQSTFSLKRPCTYKILWQDIEVVGRQTVLVKKTQENTQPANKTKSFMKIFSK